MTIHVIGPVLLAWTTLGFAFSVVLGSEGDTRTWSWRNWAVAVFLGGPMLWGAFSIIKLYEYVWVPFWEYLK